MYDALVIDTPQTVVKKMVEPDDATLLRRSSHQDMAAFELLYRKFHPRIYSFIFRLLGNRELSEEAASDTLYAVWKSAGSFQGKSAVSTWILGIAYRTALKALDKNARHTRKRDNLDTLDDITETHPGHDPAQVTGTLIDTIRVQAAITKLSTEQQAVVQLTAVGHSCEEIATILECPRNTVKTRMFHARKQLQRYLKAGNADNHGE